MPTPRSLFFRVVALILAALALWALPGIVQQMGAGGAVQLVFNAIAMTGAIFLIPLFTLYALRGPGPAERVLERVGFQLRR